MISDIDFQRNQSYLDSGGIGLWADVVQRQSEYDVSVTHKLWLRTDLKIDRQKCQN